MLQPFALQTDFLISLFNVDYDFNQLALLLLHDRSLFAQLFTVRLDLFHRALQFLEALLVSGLNLDHVVLSFLEQSLEDTEGAHEEYRCEV